jgi:hypothetical protein
LSQWCAEEIRQIEAIVADIAVSRLPRTRHTGMPVRREAPIVLPLSQGLALVEGLAGSTRALLVRQLLRELGFGEHRHLQWRVEHKLIQALVLRQWIPESIPVTSGLNHLTRTHGPAGLRQFLADNYPAGYLIKTALGDSSGELSDRDGGERILHATESGETPAPCLLLDETYVVQERIGVATEYRVHSIENEVIPDLTFRRYDAGSIEEERKAPNAFVSALLNRLPDALVGGSLLAWDIALTTSGEFAVIEVNFSGFHPAFKRGFHCSGYFHDQNWGACDTARLLNHIAHTDGVEVTPQPDAPARPIENRFYQDVAIWQLRHRGLQATLAPRALDERSEEALIDERSEDALLEPFLREIDRFAGPRRREPVDAAIELRLSGAIPLLANLAATTRALLTRQVLLALGFDERRLAAWRLEHKLLQALVFRHYNSGSLPATRGLDRLTQGLAPHQLRAFLKESFPQGFIIKTALGDCSGNDIDRRTEAALSWMESGGRNVPAVGYLTDEEFIVQERKAIHREYRVHTVEDNVIGDLTVHRHQGLVAPGERQGPNGYVQRILDSLPAGLTSGANLAWDVALLSDGSFATIEVNVGGIHTVWNPGFHASGFFHHRDFGAIYFARLLLFLERTYRCRLSVVADAPGHPDEHYFYSEVADWKSRFPSG